MRSFAETQMFNLKHCRLQPHQLSHLNYNCFIVPAPFLLVSPCNYRTVLWTRALNFDAVRNTDAITAYLLLNVDCLNLSLVSAGSVEEEVSDPFGVEASTLLSLV